MSKDSLGDRMKKNYEDRYRLYLTRRTPVIIRLDGKAFTQLTKNCKKPFDEVFSKVMIHTSAELFRQLQGVKCIYQQSDEISILLTDFDTLTTEAWFDYNLQKMISVSAAIASTAFSSRWFGKEAQFDARAFNIPKEEVCNYFIWRQKDWIRNSVSMLARAHFSHKECLNKNQGQLHEMLHSVGINWATDLATHWKNGIFILKHDRDLTVYTDVVLTENRQMIEDLLKDKEEKE